MSIISICPTFYAKPLIRNETIIPLLGLVNTLFRTIPPLSFYLLNTMGYIAHHAKQEEDCLKSDPQVITTADTYYGALWYFI